ncbi:MAG: chemotaxis response regulator protein-glutamate methylesterase [Firmicutes bacterium]|nr:chemotaxis response regulator protein-glutamate methylesterase [Bacillota bacterium]
MISVFLIDDSVLIRKRITRILDSDRRIQVIGSASNGEEALQKLETIKPDVITLDVEMPKINGLEFLKLIGKKSDIPIIMLSALTKQGADVTIKALELGAIDFICKPTASDPTQMEKFSKELILKIRSAALMKKDSKIQRPAAASNGSSAARPSASALSSIDLSSFKKKLSNPAVAIGISTGGPKTLLHVIPEIPADFPAPIFVAQHMPQGFTKSLAERLDSISKIQVKEARNGEAVKPGTCYIAPGDNHLTVMNMSLSKGKMVKVSDQPRESLYKPSVDIMFESIAEIYGGDAIAIVMTGMGTDGTKGIKVIRNRGGKTIAEDKSSCIVYGMPRSVIEAGLADFVLPAPDIPSLLKSLLKPGAVMSK